MSVYDGFYCHLLLPCMSCGTRPCEGVLILMQFAMPVDPETMSMCFALGRVLN
jgi:hypothetical protein